MRSMENIQNVFMRLFQCKKQSTYTKCLASAESASLTRTSYTDVFQRRVYGFNKPDAWLNRDVSELVI